MNRFLLFLLVVGPFNATATLLPGFDKNEYLEVLRLAAHSVDTPWTTYKVPLPEQHQLVFRSNVVGLDNRADIWLRNDGAVHVHLRGTTAREISWMENFYAAQIPAQGTIKLANDYNFSYDFSNARGAAVHVGWTIGTGFLLREILPVLDSFYRTGARELLISGHSQGGALTFLTSAYLLRMQQIGKFPAAWKLKTYASAAPKPGNLAFAYDFERLTAGGWAFSVLHPYDWVPESPVTLQTQSDFNLTNPFRDVKPVFKKMPLFKRMALKYAFNRLTKPSRRAQKNYTRYLGKTVAGIVGKSLPGFEAPAYLPSVMYMRCGVPIILYPNDAYRNERPDPDKNVFIHHMPEAYYVLSQQLPN